MTEHFVSLQEMAARFEHLTDDELEIATELTIPVTISVYRGHTEDGSAPPLYCTLQFGEHDYYGYSSHLLDEEGKDAHKLEDVSEAFGISMDAKTWEIIVEDESEEAPEDQDDMDTQHYTEHHYQSSE